MGGIGGGRRFESSGRFEGVPGYRASSAFDGSARTAWVGAVTPGKPAWISAQLNAGGRTSRLEMAPGPPEYRHPATIRVSDGASEQVASVSPRGEVRLRSPVSTDRLRIEIVSLNPPTADQRKRNLRAVSISEIRVRGVAAIGPRTAGRFSSRCGSITAASGDVKMDGLLSGSVRDLDEGRPLELSGCPANASLAMNAGMNRLGIRGDGVTQPDEIALVSPAPRPLPVAPVGRVSEAGTGDFGHRSRIKLEVRRPGWLILGESYSRAWKAECRTSSGEKLNLGSPTPIDGFANGWRVGTACTSASMAFGPQRLATTGYVVSLAGCLVLLALLLLGLKRGMGSDLATPRFAETSDEPSAHANWTLTAALTAAAAAAGTLVFAVRVGAAVALVTLVLARQGISPRRFLIPGTVLLSLVPVAYLANPPADLGGFNFDYASEQLPAHWAAAIGVSLIFIGCLILARQLRHAIPARRGNDSQEP